MTHDENIRGRALLCTLGLLCATTIGIGCGDDTATGGGGTGPAGGGGNPPAGGENPGGAGGQGGAAVGGQGGTGGDGGGGAPATYQCLTEAPAETRGSAIALSPDNEVMLVANRDADSVTVFSLDAAGVPTKELTIGTGVDSEPWQVAIDGCSGRGYVVLRGSQKVVAIESLKSNPALGAEVAVGSEPTGLAISPYNTRLYVSNWVEGTVDVIDTEDMTLFDTVDLNATLAATGLLGTVSARPALAHPRAIAVTNNKNENDADETIVVTEWSAQRTEPEAANGSNADTSKKGLIYRINAGSLAVTTADLPPVAVTGFKDHNNGDTGCFPNQVSSVTLKGSFAYVTSTCASPKGPLGLFKPTATCTTDAQCGVLGGVCNLGTGLCDANFTDVKTTTHPALSIVDLSNGSGTTQVLDALFDAPTVDSARMPLLPTDLGFFGNFAYVSSQGSDAVFRVEINGGAIVSVGATNDFINLRVDSNDTEIKSPVGIATSNTADARAYTANDGTWNVSQIDLAAQTIVGTPVQSVNLPSGAELSVLRGKRFFNTGLGRWSRQGEGWGACAVCHVDGLTDNVTWYFGRGPRQSVSLDGSFSSSDPSDQRIFNWTGIFDEVADFENNTRNVSGGLGAIVGPGNVALNTGAETPPQQGLSGSSEDFADPAGPSASTLEDWNEINLYIQSIRSPKKPVGLDAAAVAAGKVLFETSSQGNCVGCHSGNKWTISRISWDVNDTINAGASTAAGTLRGTTWNVNLNGFPAALLPVDAANLTPTNAVMLFGAPPGAEQMQCALRPVGTFNVAPAAVGIAELRQDMTTPGQGAAATGRGFNVPSLLGNQSGAPFYHAGNARTLEEVFDNLFLGHHQSAVAQVFAPSDTQKQQLIAYLLSIDESSTAPAIPAKGATGGDLCFSP